MNTSISYIISRLCCQTIPLCSIENFPSKSPLLIVPWSEYLTAFISIWAMGSRTLISVALLVFFVAVTFVECQDLNIIDITHEYVPTMPSYGSQKGLGEILTLVCDQRKGFKTTNSLLTIQVHSGTHTDAPSHAFIDFFDQKVDATTLDLQTLNGEFLFIVLIYVCSNERHKTVMYYIYFC